MDIPCNFKDVPHPDSSWLQKEGSDRPSPSCMSMKRDESMDRLSNFKRQNRSPTLSELSTSVLTSDHVRCPVCSSLLRDPVSIPCGHNYCQHCINTYWSQPGPTGDYVCLQCEKSYPVRPELSVNVALNWMLQVHQQTACSPACPTLPQVQVKKELMLDSESEEHQESASKRRKKTRKKRRKKIAVEKDEMIQKAIRGHRTASYHLTNTHRQPVR